MKFDPLKVADEIGSDEWWVDRLLTQLMEKYPRIKLLEDWAAGEPPIPVTSVDENEGMKIVRRMTRINLVPTIVSNISSKMVPEGFRTAAANDDTGDTEAQRIWKQNNMKIVSKEIFNNMLTFGESYSIVGSRTVGGVKRAVITSEHPRQVITENDPVFRHETIAALKMYRDDVRDQDIIVLYRLDASGRPYRRVLTHDGVTRIPNRDASVWTVDGDWDWAKAERLKLSSIPVQRFATTNGKGIFEEHIGSLQSINEGRFQRTYINISQAARQQMLIRPPEPEVQATGVTQFDKVNGTVPSPEELAYKRQQELEEDDSLFGALVGGPGTRWELPHGTEFRESASTDSRNVDEALKTDIRILGEVTGTQFTMAISESVNMSASGANAMTARGFQIAREQRDVADAPLGSLLGHAFEQEGDAVRARREDIEVIWVAIDNSSMKEKAEAAKAAKEAGLPWRLRMEYIFELKPEQMRAADRERVNEMFAIDPEVETDGDEDTSGTQTSNPPIGS